MTNDSVTTIKSAPIGGELRTGTWTRLGDSRVLGDRVTEEMLSDIALRAKAAAQAQGYAIGWAEGRRAAEAIGRQEVARIHAEATRMEEQRQAEHRAAVDALRAAATELRGTVGAICEAIESQSTELAMKLTEAILGRELHLATDPGADAVRRALQFLPDESLVTIHMHPDDLHTVDASELADVGARLVADPALSRGDVVVVANDHVIDGRADAALARVQEVFGA